MIRTDILRKFIFNNKPIRFRSTTKVDLDELEQTTTTTEVPEAETTKLSEKEIERKRNKSRLKPSDRNFLFESNPYPEPEHWNHGTLKYKRRLYGRYGTASGVDPAICWPVKDELEDKIEYERVAHPFTIPQMLETAKAEKKRKEDEVQARQRLIVERMKKLDQWTREWRERVAKKEAEATQAKARKERLVEEVRLHFGYKIDPKDEKFKEMLDKKEKEQKKALKDARKKAREEKMLKEALGKKGKGASTKSRNEKDNEEGKEGKMN